MNCQKCGKENPSFSKFCLACGNPLPIENKKQVEKQASADSGEKCLGMGTNVAAALSYIGVFYRRNLLFGWQRE